MNPERNPPTGFPSGKAWEPSNWFPIFFFPGKAWVHSGSHSPFLTMSGVTFNQYVSLKNPEKAQIKVAESLLLLGWIFRLVFFGFPSYFLLTSKKFKTFCWGIYSTREVSGNSDLEGAGDHVYLESSLLRLASPSRINFQAKSSFGRFGRSTGFKRLSVERPNWMPRPKEMFQLSWGQTWTFFWSNPVFGHPASFQAWLQNARKKKKQRVQRSNPQGKTEKG